MSDETGEKTSPTRHPPAESPIGAVYGAKYKITRLLGEGGMGSVYEAQHIVVGRRFAVKLLRAEVAAQKDMLVRFQREAETAGALESENIAAVIDFGLTATGAPYIVMELLQGEDLGSLLAREGPLPVPRVVNLIIQACRGLDLAHAKGIVHRDLKPENLFVCRRADGSDLVKLLDFGIAKLRSADPKAASFTRTGTAMGTPYYMPPEQARGAKSIDHRADVYALGVILYELLSGAKPHPGESYNEILSNILMTEPVALAKMRPELPEALCAAIHRALSKDPAARQQMVSELVDALVPFAGRAVTPLTRAGMVHDPRPPAQSTLTPAGQTGFADTHMSGERAATTATPGSISENPPALPARSRTPVFIAIGVVATALFGGGWVATHGRQPPEEVKPVVVPPPPPPVAAPAPLEVVEPVVAGPIAAPDAGRGVVAPPATPGKPAKPPPRKIRIDSDNPYR